MTDSLDRAHAETYDFVIVGGGTAGCVLANRLSAQPGAKVLLLEAGPNVEEGRGSQDIRSAFPMSYFNSRHFWPDLKFHLRTRANSPASAARQGKLLGGGSAVMGMMAFRGTSDDFEEWAQAGAQGWRWDDVLPYYKRLEDAPSMAGEDDGQANHGIGGPTPIRIFPPESWPPFARAALAYAEKQQIRFLDDLNGGTGDGIGPSPMASSERGRSTTVFNYLGPSVRQRPNLRIETGVMAETLVIEAGRAVGVRARRDRRHVSFLGNKIILAAGAIQTPALLQRSGVGDGERLKAAGIAPLIHRPGVGANLQNHLVVQLAADLVPQARQHPDFAGFQNPTWRYSSGLDSCPSDMCITLAARTAWHRLGSVIGAVMVQLLKPHSRGQVNIVSPDPTTYPLIEYNAFSDSRDKARLIDGFKRSIAMLTSEDMRPQWRSSYPLWNRARMLELNDLTFWNGLKSFVAATAFDLNPALARRMLSDLSMRGLTTEDIAADDTLIDEFVDDATRPMAHPVGTCRMGAREDAGAVVDASGRFIGLDALHVADASVMPTITRGNTNLPTIMIAEKTSDAILAS